MKKLWQILGVTAYWLTVPGIWLVLRKTIRTRLLVRSGDHIIVVKPWLGNGKWCLPGGGVHKNEPTLTAVIRETREEVGITIDSQVCISHGTRPYRQNGLSFNYELFTTDLDAQVPIKKQVLEIFDAQWVAVSSLSDQNANQDVLVALQKSRK
jgi:8-oxo-dGTP pyrophosphatase MutT (NUDIX family)